MKNLQQQFIDFLIAQGALKFGEFTLKSGRISPYFFNLGTFNTGASLAKLGHFYAATLVEKQLSCDMLFGPAYKGIPLVSATSIALATEFNRDLPYCFNRKLKKTYGDGGDLVGKSLEGKVVMVDDVITAGTTVRDTIELMQHYPAELAGILIAFNRQEKGEGERSAIEEVVNQYKIPIYCIVTLADVISYLHQQGNYQQQLEAIEEYRMEYGVV